MSSIAPPRPHTAPRPQRRALAELRRCVAGRLHTPDDPSWELARTPWALSVVQTPLAVLEVRDANDVQAAVRWAVEHDVQVSAQPGGHGASGALDGVLLLRTRALAGIEIDAERRTAWVGAGVKAGELLAALDGTGLTFLAGSTGDVSVVGLTIGGGMSWFGRAYGLGANSVVAVDLVDGLGRARRVSRAEHPELFWAIRGGGGDFGIVTRMAVALHPARNVYGGRLFWPLARMGEVLRAFRTATATAPPELTLWFHVYRFPPLPHVPEPMRGKAFASVAVGYLGDERDGIGLLRPLTTVPDLVMQTMGDVPLASLGTICAEPVEPSLGLETSALLTGLDDVTIDRLVAVLGAGSASPLAVFQIRHLGAAFAVTSPEHGAAGRLNEPYLMFALGIPAAPGLAEAIGSWFPKVHDAVASNSAGHTVFNFLGPDGDVDAVWPPDVRARLSAAKADADPLHTIRSNRPVRGSDR